MASVLENVGGAIYIAKNPRRRVKSWLLEEEVGAVIAVCTLPESSIDDANMRSATCENKIYDNTRHAPSLADVPDHTKLWRGRPPRSYVDQFKKIMRDCSSLHGHALQVEFSKPTGNPSETDVMRLAVALCNKTATPSQT
jgi:hypothetical protein